MVLRVIKTYRRERWVQVVLSLIVIVWVVVLFVKYRGSVSDHVPQVPSVPPVVTDLSESSDSTVVPMPNQVKKREALKKHKTEKKHQAVSPIERRDHLNETSE